MSSFPVSPLLPSYFPHHSQFKISKQLRYVRKRFCNKYFSCRRMRAVCVSIVHVCMYVVCICTYFSTLAVEPHSLKHLCRLQILAELGRKDYKKTVELPLPAHLRVCDHINTRSTASKLYIFTYPGLCGLLPRVVVSSPSHRSSDSN